jgi:hypothetical protein
MRRQHMSIRFAVDEIQARVQEAMAANAKADMLSAMREADFGLAVLAAVLADDVIVIEAARREGTDPDADWPDGVSDDQPEQETPAERRQREQMTDKGFFS